MEETLEMMRGIITGKEKEINDQELIMQYQLYRCPNILAYFFTSNIGIIKRTNNLYPILNEEDKASFCLSEMDKCLLNFDILQNTKFITYFIRCYKNKLRTETENLLTLKRKSIFYTENLEDVNLYNNDIEMEDINSILANYSLDTKEKHQCLLLNAGYTIKEIASILKLSTITIYARNKQIKQKILNSLINFE